MSTIHTNYVFWLLLSRSISPTQNSSATHWRQPFLARSGSGFSDEQGGVWVGERQRSAFIKHPCLLGRGNASGYSHVGLARPEGGRTTLTDGRYSQSETSGVTTLFINAVTPARLG